MKTIRKVSLAKEVSIKF